MSEQRPQFQTLQPSAGAKPRKSRVIPIVLTIVCGVFLALGSCFGFVATLNTNEGQNRLLNTLSVWGMFAGAFLLLAGIVWAVVALILHVFRVIKGNS